MEIKNFDPDVVLLISNFLQHYGEFERDDRRQIMKWLNELILPKYIIHNKLPIEDDWAGKDKPYVGKKSK